MSEGDFDVVVFGATGDITGEPEFVAGIQDRYHEAAVAAGVAVVPCCGFDSIPADLGALFTVFQLPEGSEKVVDARRPR